MDTTQNYKKYLSPAIILLALFLFVQTINGIKTYGHIGDGMNQSLISVSGDGEVFAAPDIATFTFSVTETGKDAQDAQAKINAKINPAIEALKKNGIDEKDFKTVDFSSYPKYEYSQGVCTNFSCPPSNQTLVGYEMNQTISVKVRAIDDASKVISAVTGSGVSQVSNVSFTIDDEDELISEAREMAITEAKEKAEALADDLDVRLVRIVNFSENGGGYPMSMSARGGVMMDSAKVENAPTLPTGQNKIISNVTITYEIK